MVSSETQFQGKSFHVLDHDEANKLPWSDVEAISQTEDGAYLVSAASHEHAEGLSEAHDQFATLVKEISSAAARLIHDYGLDQNSLDKILELSRTAEKKG